MSSINWFKQSNSFKVGYHLGLAIYIIPIINRVCLERQPSIACLPSIFTLGKGFTWILSLNIIDKWWTEMKKHLDFVDATNMQFCPSKHCSLSLSKESIPNLPIDHANLCTWKEECIILIYLYITKLSFWLIPSQNKIKDPNFYSGTCLYWNYHKPKLGATVHHSSYIHGERAWYMVNAKLVLLCSCSDMFCTCIRDEALSWPLSTLMTILIVEP